MAEAFARHEVGFSPHNPSGPVCHAASLQICSAVPQFERLEMQYDETTLFDALVAGALPKAVDGEVRVPHVPGLGVRLDPVLGQRLRIDVRGRANSSTATPTE